MLFLKVAVEGEGETTGVVPSFGLMNSGPSLSGARRVERDMTTVLTLLPVVMLLFWLLVLVLALVLVVVLLVLDGERRSECCGNSSW